MRPFCTFTIKKDKAQKGRILWLRGEYSWIGTYPPDQKIPYLLTLSITKALRRRGDARLHTIPQPLAKHDSDQSRHSRKKPEASKRHDR